MKIAGNLCMCDSCGATTRTDQFGAITDHAWRTLIVQVSRDLEPANYNNHLGNRRHACSEACEQRIKRGTDLNVRLAQEAVA